MVFEGPTIADYSERARDVARAREGGGFPLSKDRICDGDLIRTGFK